MNTSTKPRHPTYLRLVLAVNPLERIEALRKDLPYIDVNTSVSQKLSIRDPVIVLDIIDCIWVKMLGEGAFKNPGHAFKQASHSFPYAILDVENAP